MSKRALKVERVEHPTPPALIFRLAGDLTDRRECYDFLDELRREFQDGRKHVVVNLAEVGFISSSGVGILAASYTSARKAEARLVLAAASDRDRTLLELVNLWDMFEHHDSEEAALAAAAS